MSKIVQATGIVVAGEIDPAKDDYNQASALLHASMREAALMAHAGSMTPDEAKAAMHEARRGMAQKINNAR